jgi:hypothetical protein
LPHFGDACLISTRSWPLQFYLASHDDGERRLLGRYVSSIRRFYPHREIVFGLP